VFIVEIKSMKVCEHLQHERQRRNPANLWEQTHYGPWEAPQSDRGGL